MYFNTQESQRYQRHFTLKLIGKEGQLRLKQSRVLCVGAGGLGSPALMYLAAAGIGTIGIVDQDIVELSNLQRQILYSEQDVNQQKAVIARQTITALNSSIDVIAHPIQLNENNIFDIIQDYDLVLDGSDNFATRYLINDACFHSQKPNIFAAVNQFNGMCSIFCVPGYPCYRCLYPTLPPAGLIQNCAEAGVLGVLPGLLGTIQATEAIKYLLQIGEPLLGRLLNIDALLMDFKHYQLEQAAGCELCILQRPFNTLVRPPMTSECNNHFQAPSEVPQISGETLKQLLALNQVFLLDVRERSEYEMSNLNGYLIPLAELPQRVSELDKNQYIVVHCHSGVRSRQAVTFLQQAGFTKVANLQGGIVAMQNLGM